jgi:hypothetical protein
VPEAGPRERRALLRRQRAFQPCDHQAIRLLEVGELRALDVQTPESVHVLEGLPDAARRVTGELVAGREERLARGLDLDHQVGVVRSPDDEICLSRAAQLRRTPDGHRRRIEEPGMRLKELLEDLAVVRRRFDERL